MATAMETIPTHLIVLRNALARALQGWPAISGDMYLYLPPTTVTILYEYSCEPSRSETFQIPAQTIRVRSGECTQIAPYRDLIVSVH